MVVTSTIWILASIFSWRSVVHVQWINSYQELPWTEKCIFLCLAIFLHYLALANSAFRIRNCYLQCFFKYGSICQSFLCVCFDDLVSSCCGKMEKKSKRNIVKMGIDCVKILRKRTDLKWVLWWWLFQFQDKMSWPKEKLHHFHSFEHSFHSNNGWLDFALNWILHCNFDF